jgi:hypothetical protein
MPLTNAEKQARFRNRNVITLTANAHEIAHRLLAMDDKVKLALIAAILDRKLHPPQDGRCRFVKDDGGRTQSGIARGGRNGRIGQNAAAGDVRDCAPRAIAIAAGKPYREVHDALIAAAVRYAAAGGEARRKGGYRAFHADYGVPVGACRLYLESLGWRYTSCRELPRGKGIHLRADELPPGRLIVRLRWHMCAVIDGVIHDIHDYSDEGRRRIYGYWTEAKADQGGHTQDNSTLKRNEWHLTEMFKALDKPVLEDKD